MALRLVSGPPNSARAGELVRGFRDALGREPVLVVPTADDAERFERELSDQGPLLGGSVVTFGGLFGEVARACELPWGGGVSAAQSILITRMAVARAGAGSLAGSAGGIGFAPAFAELVEELEAGLVDPATLTDRATGAGAYERDIARLYGEWVAIRDELGLSDLHRMATRISGELGARAHAGEDPWGGRPVFIYGFDDLTREQLELVRSLAASTDVTVAVTFEPDNPALAARARLHQELKALFGEGQVDEKEVRPDDKVTPNRLLWHLERGFLRAEAEPRSPGEGFDLLRAAGERAEAEQIAGEVARLIAAGEDPDEIAIVVRSPSRHATLWSSVLARMRIPAAVEASVPLTSTATGRTLAAACRALSPEGEAADLIAYLRGPRRGRPGRVDHLERRVRREGARTAADAAELWREMGGYDAGLDRLREAGAGGPLLGEVAALARDVAEYPLKRAGAVPDQAGRLELRAAASAASALTELAELDPPRAAMGPGEIADVLAGLTVRMHEGPAHGRVRVVSPYRLRARRVHHLFVASLQDGEFPRRDPGSPLLSDDRRRDLGLPERTNPDDEERYLFAICLSRPEQSLTLSWRDADDGGRELARSPFVDEVCTLVAAQAVADAADPVAAAARSRGPGEVVMGVARSSSPAELARSVAALGRDRAAAALEGMGLEGEVASELRGALGEARAATAPDVRQPVGLRSEPVLAELAAYETFGASTLEEYRGCSYRWFAGKELRADPLDRDDEQLRLGSLAHAVLERLYRSQPGGTPRPEPASLAEWRRRSRELTEQLAGEKDLPSADPLTLTQIRRVEGLLDMYLGDQAAAPIPMAPDPDLIEAKFGDPGQKHGLELEGFRLHGMIDRVDVLEREGVRYALITDYKLGKSVAPAAKFEDEGKLQLQLYMLAVENWGLTAIGGVYVPLGAKGGDRRPRGLLDKDHKDMYEGLGEVGYDCKPGEDFREQLERAREQAEEVVADIKAGRIRRNPIGGECPRYCDFQQICRRERGVPEPEDERDYADEEAA